MSASVNGRVALSAMASTPIGSPSSVVMATARRAAGAEGVWDRGERLAGELVDSRFRGSNLGDGRARITGSTRDEREAPRGTRELERLFNDELEHFTHRRMSVDG